MNVAKYSEGDIFTHREIPNKQRKILYSYYDQSVVYYMIQNMDNDTYPPSPIEETNLDKYYTIVK